MRANINQVRTILDTNFQFLYSNYKVKNIGVFGSVARGDNIEGSDIDLLVEFSEPVGFFKFIQLERYLSEILGYKVDLVTKKALKPSIKEDILQEVIYV